MSYQNLAIILTGAKGSLHPTNSYTGQRWNEYACIFQIDIDDDHFLEYLKNDDFYTKRLEYWSNT